MFKAVSISSRLALAAATLAGTLVAAPLPVNADAVSDAGAKAMKWLITKQEADGGYSSGFAPGSDVGVTADAVLAFVAAKQPLAQVRSRLGRTPLDYLATQARKKLSIGQYAKIALAVKAAGLNPARFGGKNLISLIQAGYDAKTGVIGDNVFIHGLAIVTLANAGATVPATATTTLESYQAANGGWAFMGAGAPDVDTTAMAVQALIALGRPKTTGAVARGLGYLHSLQNADGGYPYQSPSDFGTDTNANSTGLVAQAIIAGGDQPESWAAAKGNPLGALVALQQPSGSIAYQSIFPGDNAVATIGAIPALYRVSLVAP